MLVELLAAGVALLTSIGSIRLSQGLGYLPNAVIRAALTFIQTVAGIAIAGHPLHLGAFHWQAAIATALAATVASLLTSLASNGTGHDLSPSLVRAVR